MKRPRTPMLSDLWKVIADVFWTRDVDGVGADRESVPDAYDDLIREAAVRLYAGHDSVEIARAILAKVAVSRDHPGFSAEEVARLASELTGAMALVSGAPEVMQKPDWIIDLSEPPPIAQPDDGIEALKQTLGPYFERVSVLVRETDQLSREIRDAAARGASNHRLAADLGLRIETVDRVLAGDPLVTFS